MQQKQHNILKYCKQGSLYWLPCLLVATLLAIAGCSSIDCPVQNRVYTVYSLKKANGTADTLKVDTLSICSRRADGRDTILQNRITVVTTFDLDISYINPVDTLHMTLLDTMGNTYRDTIWVEKSNQPHFESVDCQISYFHTILSVKSTHHIIDSLSINNSQVNYDASKEHFHLYLKDRY